MAMEDETLDIGWDLAFKVFSISLQKISGPKINCLSSPFKWASQMMVAIITLHSFDPPIYHRDLKSPNLLVRTFKTPLPNFPTSPPPKKQNL